MHLLSINISPVKTITMNGREFSTAIDRRPVPGPVAVTELGLEGDGIGSPKHHGGPDQAVYLYGAVDYEWWESQLGRDLPPGMFGDNLTIAGLSSLGLGAGDRLRIGEHVELEVTGPRIPCGTFAAKMGDPEFPERFRHAKRPGAYTRVIQTGVVAPGDDVVLERTTGPTISLSDLVDLAYDTSAPVDDVKRALAAPIHERARSHYERRLAKRAGS